MSSGFSVAVSCGIGAETQALEVSLGEGIGAGCVGTARGAKEQCTTGGGAVCIGLRRGRHSRGNPGEGPDPQERQGTILGRGEEDS